MTSKPSSSAGYSNQGLDRVRQVCLYMATKLGDLLEEIVVVGGLVPYLLVDQDNLPAGATPHVGTMDLDMGLALAMLNQERYRELGSRLRDAGFEPEINAEGNRRLQSWTTGPPYHVTVDFLIPPNDETDVGGGILHLDSDLAAIVTPGLELAFKDRQWKELSGPVPSGASATRSIPSCGPGAFTVLKACLRQQAEKQGAYDFTTYGTPLESQLLQRAWLPWRPMCTSTVR